MNKKSNFPVLPLRDVVVFPHMAISLFVAREKSILALEYAIKSCDNKILLASQLDENNDDPDAKGLCSTMTLAKILQILKMPDGTLKVLVEGNERALVERIKNTVHGLEARVTFFERDDDLDAPECESLARHALEIFEKLIGMNQKVPEDVYSSIAGLDNVSRMADAIAAHVELKLVDKQALLETLDTRDRLELLIDVLDRAIDQMALDKKVRKRVKKQMEKSQREYYLNEQVKAINKEISGLDGSPDADEYDELAQRIEQTALSDEAREKAAHELKRLRQMQSMSSEAGVVRNYLDTLLDLPWGKCSELTSDLAKAENILNADHYGLNKVKERILEYLAVQCRVGKMRSQILCLVGAPGVGKTSLGRSIARATGRGFCRVPLGGVRDESEIRGHRRTYIGSMPGRILQKLARIGTDNPLMLLDEIDKMSQDFHGDPASALLEVLDAEQNHDFNDHYLEVGYDLSGIMFLCTANSLSGIPAPLLDRMEVVHLSGYTEQEKLNIARRYLLPRQVKENGLDKGEFRISNAALLDVVRYYTREAGVRQLDRSVARLCRKAVYAVQTGDNQKTSIGVKNLESWLGVHYFRYGLAERKPQVGQVCGLAWTEVGGELLSLECTVTAGKGSCHSTGRLGEVMQESVQAAMTVVRSRAASLGLAPDFYGKHELHIHVPEGAIPKDGPSAGIGMCTVLASALTGIPVCSDIAMTGEITLRGEILPIGGLKEKLLAAKRGGIKRVLIPEQNRPQLTEMDAEVTDGLEIYPVRWVDAVWQHALVHPPMPYQVDDAVPVLPEGSGDQSVAANKPH